MLIDKTYFVGENNIPNTDKEYILERLNEFIKKLEPKFLRDVLGYELYKAFINGINETTPEQKWLDLRDGVEYTNLSNKLDTWMGFTGLLGNELNITAYYGAPGDRIYVVGRGQSGTDPDWADPENNDTQLLDERMIGATHSNTVVSSRGYGRWRPDEITFLAGGGFGFTDPLVKFSTGDTFFVSQLTQLVFNPDQQVFQSPIANYVYFHWLKDNTTQTTGVGEAVAKAENAMVTSASNKMVRAWNEMSEQIEQLYHYLQATKTTYPEWDSQDKYCMINKFRPINNFGI